MVETLLRQWSARLAAKEMAMKAIRQILTMVVLFMTLALAQAELEAGGQYKAGALVKSSAGGITFALPKDWLGAFRQEGDQAVLVLGSNTVEGVGLAILMKGQTAAQVAQALSEAQDLGDNVVLELDGAVKTQGNRIIARYLNELYVGRALAVLGPNQNHVVYFYAGPQQNEKLYLGLLEGLAASTKFTPIQTPKPQAVTPPTGLAKEWTQLLAGMMLKYLSSYNSGGGGGGMTSERTLHLCSNGSFAYIGSSSISMNVPGATAGGGGTDRSSGRWRIASASKTTAVLVLQVDGGGEERLELSYDGQKTFVGRERWFRVESDACR
jgi:hypothetical protein